ncbi:MAG: M48 family metalloprotease [Thermodesulfobacteriota bacterium]
MRDRKLLKYKLILLGIGLFWALGMASPRSASGITLKEEEELSREFQKLIFKHYQLIKDPVVVNYVNKIGQKILAVMPPQPFAYHFYVVKEDVYNAFATPAGHIYINSGLIAAMQSEEELAGILAHEISHVASRHISQKIERSKKVNIATLAGVAAGIFLGAGGAATAANAVTIGSLAAGQSIMLAYSREDEIQADQRGLDYLDKAGYSSEGLLTILKKIRSVQWFGSKQVPSYLMTHPASEDRLAYIDTWLDRNPKPIVQIDPYEFSRAHTFLVASYQDEDLTLKLFRDAVANRPGDPLAHYGLGLIMARTGNRKDAVVHLKAALEKKAFDPYLLTDLGKIYVQDGRYPQAVAILESALSIDPGDPERLFFLGKAQLGMERFDKAADTLMLLVAKNPDYEQAYYALGEASGRQGKPADSHYYLGIYYQKTGKPQNAFFHLNRALADITDPDKKQHIENMLKELKAELKQLPPDAR